MMINNFISRYITHRHAPFTYGDIMAHLQFLQANIKGTNIKGKSVLVIGGAGSIASVYGQIETGVDIMDRRIPL